MFMQPMDVMYHHKQTWCFLRPGSQWNIS